jgi:glycerate dehydrogenase
MKAVFLDYATLGANELDSAPLFEAAPGLELFDRTEDHQRAARIKNAQIVLTNKVNLSGDLLDGAKSLRLIVLAATGTDNVDLQHAKKSGIAVCNTRAYCTQSVVEHVFAVLLHLTHSIGRFDRSVKADEWQQSGSFCMLNHPLRELSTMTIGIVGYGTLGRSVADIARQFNMNVMIARRHGTPQQDGDGRYSFEEILEQADVVSLHCPLNEDTHGLISMAQLQRMKTDAILINTARGGLVDSSALADALRNGDIGAAAIDVLTQEPPVDGDPLLDYKGDNLILTPHIAWATAAARQTAINEVAANIRAFLAGEERNRVV